MEYGSNVEYNSCRSSAQLIQEQSPSSSRAEAVRALAMRLQQSDYHSALLADELLRTQAAAAAQAYGGCSSATSVSPVSCASPPPAAGAAATAAAAVAAAAAAAAAHTRVSIDTITAASAAVGSSAGPGSCSSSASIRERLERLLHQRAEGDPSLVHNEQQLLNEEDDDDDPFVNNSRSPQQQLLNGHTTAARTRSSTVQLQQRSVAMFMSLALRSIVKARLNNCWHRWRQVSYLHLPALTQFNNSGNFW
jgi:hypothetical protein